MTRALVLGGGGPLGVGWQAGLLTGLHDAGVHLGAADLVVGTSAGAIVGAQLTTGRPLEALIGPLSARAPWLVSDEGGDLGALLADRVPADAAPEADWIAYFDFLAGADWPEAFRCTAFCLDSGTSRVWDASDRVELPRGVASSCTIPGLVSPVTIDGDQWIDGGARDVLNADLAMGHDIVVAVSCLAFEPPAGAVPELLAGLMAAARGRVEDLRSKGSAVEVVEPGEEFGELSGWGHRLMQVLLTEAAFEVGRRQADDEADRIAALWAA
jgi:NTE family protein